MTCRVINNTRGKKKKYTHVTSRRVNNACWWYLLYHDVIVKHTCVWCMTVYYICACKGIFGNDGKDESSSCSAVEKVREYYDSSIWVPTTIPVLREWKTNKKALGWPANLLVMKGIPRPRAIAFGNTQNLLVAPHPR